MERGRERERKGGKEEGGVGKEGRKEARKEGRKQGRTGEW